MTFPRRDLRSSPRPAIRKPKQAELSRIRAPEGLSPLERRRDPRHQFGREQGFGQENIAAQPFLSAFHVATPCRRMPPERAGAIGARP